MQELSRAQLKRKRTSYTACFTSGGQNHICGISLSHNAIRALQDVEQLAYMRL